MVGMTADDDELTRLRGENARLIGLLDDHGIAWHGPEPVPAPVSATPLSTDEKVALLRRLFRGRRDVYPVRWESKAGKTGYRPRVPTNGAPVSARSRASSAPTAATGFWYH